MIPHFIYIHIYIICDTPLYTSYLVRQVLLLSHLYKGKFISEKYAIHPTSHSWSIAEETLNPGRTHACKYYITLLSEKPYVIQ